MPNHALPLHAILSLLLLFGSGYLVAKPFEVAIENRTSKPVAARVTSPTRQNLGRILPGKSARWNVERGSVIQVRNLNGAELKQIRVTGPQRVAIGGGRNSKPASPSPKSRPADPAPTRGNPPRTNQNVPQGISVMNGAGEEALAQLNRIRAQPGRYGSGKNGITVPLGHIEPRPALAWNAPLAKVALDKARELATESRRRGELWVEHISPNGEGINIRMVRAGYQLPAEWYADPAENTFENLVAESDPSPTPPQLGDRLINILIQDSGAKDGTFAAGHRTALLGMDEWHSTMKDVGIGVVRFKVPEWDRDTWLFIGVIVLGKQGQGGEAPAPLTPVKLDELGKQFITELNKHRQVTPKLAANEALMNSAKKHAQVVARSGDLSSDASLDGIQNSGRIQLFAYGDSAEAVATQVARQSGEGWLDEASFQQIGVGVGRPESGQPVWSIVVIKP